MRQEDLARVYALEQRVHISPWSQNTLENCLDNDYECFVLEEKAAIIGYCIFSFVVDECHILNIAVSPEFQGQGYSHAIMCTIFTALSHRAQPIKRVFLEVRIGNTKARSLYQKWGFEVLSMRKNYYKKGEGKEDALIFMKAV